MECKCQMCGDLYPLKKLSYGLCSLCHDYLDTDIEEEVKRQKEEDLALAHVSVLYLNWRAAHVSALKKEEQEES